MVIYVTFNTCSLERDCFWHDRKNLQQIFYSAVLFFFWLQDMHLAKEFMRLMSSPKVKDIVTTMDMRQRQGLCWSARWVIFTTVGFVLSSQQMHFLFYIT